MRRLRIGVLFGGRSTEHEVSILSAQSIIAAMDPDRFEPVPLYIDKAGRWLVGGSLKRLVGEDAARKYVYLPPDPTQRSLVAANDRSTQELPSPARGGGQGGGLLPLDAVFPVFHGLNGEDGTVQGVLELANIPYVGAGVLGSALGLDKIFMKRAFAAAGLPIVDYLPITRRQYERDPDAFILLVEEKIGYPCFTKFANSGSSVGTTKAHHRAELVEGLRLASTFARKLLVERGSGRIIVNELNTIPGFTRISMYPKLWEASGLTYPRLIERLVELAIERFNDKQRSQTAIDSRLLEPESEG